MKRITLLLLLLLSVTLGARADVEWTIWEGRMDMSENDPGEEINSLYLLPANFNNLAVGDVINLTFTINDEAESGYVVLYRQDIIEDEHNMTELTHNTQTTANYAYTITSDILALFQASSFEYLIIKGKDYTLTKVSIKKTFSLIKTTLSTQVVSLGDYDNTYEVTSDKLQGIVAGDFYYIPATVASWGQVQFYYDWNNLYNIPGAGHDVWAEIQAADTTNIKANVLRVKGQNFICNGLYLLHPVRSFSIGSIGYATFSANQQVTAPNSVTAYKGTVSGDNLILSPFTDNVIPANTGAIIAGDEGAVLEFTASSVSTSETSELIACTSATDVSTLAETGYDLYVLYAGTAESETDLSLSTLLSAWGTWHGTNIDWDSESNTITYNRGNVIYNTRTTMGGWKEINEKVLTPSLFSSIVAGDIITVTASASDGGQVWIAKLTGNNWTEVNLLDGVSITTTVSYTLTADDINLIKERGIRLKGKNFTLATIEIVKGEPGGEGGLVEKDWSDYDYLQLNFSSNTLNADATFYVAYSGHDDNTTEATLTQGSTTVRIPLDPDYKNCNGNFYIYSTATSGSLTFESAALIDNDGATVAEFRKTTSGTLAANKAYLKLETGTPARLNIVFDEGETTAISSVENKAAAINDNRYYNLAGQQVCNPTKGLYIVNGKKVVIK